MQTLLVSLCSLQNGLFFNNVYLWLVLNKVLFFVADAQEEFQIKAMCLLALFELLISCEMYPCIGDKQNGKFHHIPRLERLKADSIRYFNRSKFDLLVLAF